MLSNSMRIHLPERLHTVRYVIREWDVIGPDINAGGQTPVCLPFLPDYPMAASVTTGRLCCKSIKVLSLTYCQGLLCHVLWYENPVSFLDHVVQ